MQDTPTRDRELNADALLSFQLRGRLAEINFSHIWRVIEKSKLGWKYHSGKYIAPNKTNLGTAKEAMTKMDTCALECLTFRNESKEHRMDDADANASLRELREIRKDLLTAIYKDCKANDSLLPCFYFDKDDGISEGVAEVDKETAGLSRKTRNPNKATKNSNSSSYTSATSNEPGTDTYFSKKTHTKKNQKNGTGMLIADDEGSDAVARGRLKWPSPKNCSETVQVISKGDDVQPHSNKPNAETRYLNEYSSEWKFLMSTNHSLLLFGFGSKKKLLNDFASKELQPDGDILTLNGFDPEINISQILDVVVQLFLNGIDPSPIPKFQVSAEEIVNDIGMLRTPHRLNTGIVQRAMSIGKALGARHPKPIYLVIHNIDGVGLRNSDSQRALSALVLSSNVVDESKTIVKFEDSRVVRIVASVDHVDAPLFLWDLETMHNFSWVSERARYCTTRTMLLIHLCFAVFYFDCQLTLNS